MLGQTYSAPPNNYTAAPVESDKALGLIAKWIADLGEQLAHYGNEAEDLVARVFGPEPAGDEGAKVLPPACGSLGTIERELVELERIVSRVGSAVARLQSIA